MLITVTWSVPNEAREILTRQRFKRTEPLATSVEVEEWIRDVMAHALRDLRDMKPPASGFKIKRKRRRE